MRVVVVYKQQTDYARDVDSFLFDFKRLTGHDLETIDPESRDGIMFCETYDILQYPAVIALSDSGQLQNMWLGIPLPTMSEVSYYV